MRTLANSWEATALRALWTQDRIFAKVVGKFMVFGPLVPPTMWHSVAIGGAPYTHTMEIHPQDWNKKGDCASNILVSLGLSERLVFASIMQSTSDTSTRIWKLLKTEHGSILKLQFHRQTPEGAKRPKKAWEVIETPGLLGKSFPLKEVSTQRLGEEVVFSNAQILAEKITRHMKK